VIRDIKQKQEAMDKKDSRSEIIKMLSTKSVAKYHVYDRTMEAFDLIKDFMRNFSEDVKGELENLENEVPVSFKEKGRFEMEFKVAGDLVLATMHTNVFEFPRHHAVWQNSYVKDEPMRAYCGIINIYNFLADSFKYNRLNDVGYLIGRVFINSEGHFIVEGKHQLGFRFNDFAGQIINKESANIPKSIWHRYIIDKADNLFFKIPESDVLEMAVLPLEQFYDSRNKFVSAKKVQT